MVRRIFVDEIMSVYPLRKITTHYVEDMPNKETLKPATLASYARPCV